MGAPELLTTLKAMGLTISAHGGELHVAPRAAITDEARRMIRAYKPEILAALIEPQQPGDSENDSEAVAERAAIMAVENAWDAAAALQEAHGHADREMRWRAFLRHAEALMAHPEAEHEALLQRYGTEAIKRYGERTGIDMATTMRLWVQSRSVH